MCPAGSKMVYSRRPHYLPFIMPLITKLRQAKKGTHLKINWKTPEFVYYKSEYSDFYSLYCCLSYVSLQNPHMDHNVIIIFLVQKIPTPLHYLKQKILFRRSMNVFLIQINIHFLNCIVAAHFFGIQPMLELTNLAVLIHYMCVCVYGFKYLFYGYHNIAMTSQEGETRFTLYM